MSELFHNLFLFGLRKQKIIQEKLLTNLAFFNF